MDGVEDLTVIRTTGVATVITLHGMQIIKVVIRANMTAGLLICRNFQVSLAGQNRDIWDYNMVNV